MAAAAIIPLIVAAEPILKPLIENVVVHIEHLFGAHTGDVKASVALDVVSTITKALAAGGKLPGIPDLSSLMTMIQGTVTDLKGKGILTPENAATIVANSSPTINGANPQTLRVIGGNLILAI